MTTATATSSSRRCRPPRCHRRATGSCKRYDLVAGPIGGPLAPLLDVLAVGGDVGLHVVLARRVGGSARGAYEAVFGRLRELGSPGVLLSGDPGEGPLLGGAKAQPQPAGRELLVRRGERPVLIQTAFSPMDVRETVR
jgi:DNA segregation ATPase FtsK/SpoIIIE, S-DNA-T family